jgi:Protein of unknown function (DUF3572)
VKNISPNTAEASDIALRFIGFIASDEDRLERFLGLTGISLGDLKDGANDPAFQGFVLDYAMQDESLILEFATFDESSPTKLVAARHALPGATHDF